MLINPRLFVPLVVWLLFDVRVTVYEEMKRHSIHIQLKASL